MRQHECEMNFPTADETALFLHFMRLTAIRDRVVEARPDLTELTAVAPPVLTIDLPASPTGFHNRVVLARGRGHVPHWLIVGSRGRDFVNGVWDLETADEQLRDALLATYDACLAKSETPVHGVGRNPLVARSCV